MSQQQMILLIANGQVCVKINMDGLIIHRHYELGDLLDDFGLPLYMVFTASGTEIDPESTPGHEFLSLLAHRAKQDYLQEVTGLPVRIGPNTDPLLN